MGVIAEFERGRIGERVKDSRHHILARGDWAGGSTLYGYRWHNKDRKWEIVPEEADIVKRVYALYVGEKLGMIPITQRLNDDGCLTRKGFPWHATSVRQVLTHPAYKGNIRSVSRYLRLLTRPCGRRPRINGKPLEASWWHPRAGFCKAWWSAASAGMP